MLLLQDRIQALYNILEKLGFEKYQDVATDLRKRILLQKQIFILQELGLKLGYLFRWYKYGPHSKELSDEFDEIFLRLRLRKPLPQKEFESSDELIIESFLQLNNKIQGNHPEAISDVYEKFASIYFLYNQFPSRYKSGTSTREEIQNAVKDNLCSIKHDICLSDEEASEIFQKLIEFKLITDIE